MKYPEHFKIFINLHKISEFFESNPKLRGKYSGASELVFKIENIEMSDKLCKIVNLRYAMAAILKQKPSKLELVSVEKGCLLVAFLIPTAVAEVIFAADEMLSTNQIKELRSLSILWLKCGDRTIEVVPEGNTEENSQISDSGDSVAIQIK